MLMIRLQRVGRKHDPSYRIVVTEKTRGPKSGDYIEIVGNYDARKEKGKSAVVKEDRVKHWISVGAQPSATVQNILISTGIVTGKKIAVHSKKNAGKKEEEAAAAEAKSAEASSEASTDDAAPATDDKPAEEDAESAKEETKEEAPAPAEEAKPEEKPAEAEPAKEEAA